MRPTLLILTAALALIACTAPQASAASADPIKYPAEIQGSWYVVTVDDAVMRAGEEEVYYAIAKFAKGSMVVATSNTDRYAAAYYPLSFGALVPVGQVERNDDNTVTLIEESTLRAPSSLLGMSGSWKGLYTIPLLDGTEMEIMEELKSESGHLVGYRVVPPHPPVSSAHPVGYIKMSNLRPATASEVEQFLGHEVTAPVTLPNQPLEPIEIPEVEVIDSVVVDTTDTSLMEEMVEPEVVEPEVTLPTDTLNVEISFSPAEPEAADEPVVINNTVIIPDKSASPKNASILSPAALETLEATFNAARALPRDQLDGALEELLAEYTRAYDAAGDDKSLARALDQRMEWLNIRIETRDQRRAIARALQQSNAEQQIINERIAQWKAGQAYIIVGRMTPSAVYTGEHLPLLYRVQGNDAVTGVETTIGYIAPSETQDFRHLLGRVVGVIGSAELDNALNLRIIRPSRIDAMPE